MYKSGFRKLNAYSYSKCVKVAQKCLTLCDPMDYMVRVILQGFSLPRDRTQVSHIAGGFFTSGTTKEAQEY